ncbi:MAG: FapA family protein [Desulfobacula sp.]|uniref:flagellar assembly protein A n=1 Tax=Desulfobacula sp. TaxID=2593537 RepID=UPI0025C3E1DE|nr:flagellar assembly protein A [Desulfobacula sp.]MCD4721106.1 FapA family protein [Desulfobacula sp.]
MTEKKKPKVIILESNDTIREHAESILSKSGWDVTCEQVSKEALNTLTQSKKTLFALFISNFKLPKMEGDDILQKVKSISPLTQRMLLIPADKPDILISAINKAEINACIISPFNDEDLIDQAKNCFKHFKHTLKRLQLKRVTVHQNKQMFKIAQSLKKKDTAYKHLIDEKKAQKLMLKSKKRSTENESDLNTNLSLSSLMEHKKIAPAPDTFKNEFIAICKTIQGLFDRVTTKHHSDPVNLNFGKIVTEEGQDLQENKPAPSELLEKIIKEALTRMITTEIQSSDKFFEADDTATDTTDDIINEYFEISISESQTKATIKKIKDPDNKLPTPGLSDLLDMLRQKQISYGILDDEAIEIWISKSFTEEIIIATGEDPVHGHDREIKFHFETDFTNPGKINEDGSIDFRERGNIPHVNKEDLLAQKIPPQESKPGITVSGIPIPVNEIIDPVFVAGSGTEMSEDELSIHAVIDGQPHLDAMGTISVNPELIIPGNVDFQTGNIDFKGNIVVKGMIKEGFTVKGINLTAQEIEGGTIDMSGDLNISAGITDSNISAHGNIYAKFINHSNIMGFGDLVISKEIIDSDIMLSGSCQNQTGHIISSQVTAKMGIEAGKIGTSSSKPVKLKVGVDEHIEILKKQIVETLEASVSKSNLLKDEIKKLENQDQELYLTISEKAHIQDRAQLEIKELKNSQAEGDQTKKIKKLNEKAKIAEKELNTIFETQDKIADQIEQIKNQIAVMEGKNKNLVIEKKALKEFSKKDRPQAVVTVAKTITQDSIIRAPHSSIILKEDASRCKIQETGSDEEGIPLYEMNILDL